ncbi:MAG: hypothetical protein KBT27_11205 [Prevotellaceae bacterium]|nr:hypothetical protein [Candidatus Faecinaster equi]
MRRIAVSCEESINTICDCGYELELAHHAITNEEYFVCPHCGKIYKDGICISEFKELSPRDEFMEWINNRMETHQKEYNETWEYINTHPDARKNLDRLQSNMVIRAKIETYREVKNYIKVLEETYEHTY